MRLAHTHNSQRWQKTVTGSVNAASVDAQRLSASVATSGAVVQLDVDEHVSYTAVYTLASPSSQTVPNLSLSPTIQIYLSTDGRESETRSYMLVQRVPVPAPARATVAPKEGDAAAPSSTTALGHQQGTHRKSLCVSKMQWVCAAAVVLLRTNGHLVVLDTGVHAACPDAETSCSSSESEEDGGDDIVTHSRLLFEDQRVLDVASTVVKHGRKQLLVLVAAHHTHTAVTVIDVTRTSPARRTSPPHTVVWRSIGPFRSVAVLPHHRRDEVGVSVPPPSVVFAGDDVNGCLRFFDWQLPVDLQVLSSSQSTPGPRCVRECMLGSQSIPLGFVTSPPSRYSTETTQVVFVGLKPCAEGDTRSAGTVHAARLSQAPTENFVLRGKNGAPLMLDERTTESLRVAAAAHGREPLNQVYTMLHRTDPDGVSMSSAATAPSSMRALEQLGALRLVRPRLSSATMDCVALSVVVSNVHLSARGALVASTVEYTLPLKAYHDAFASLFAAVNGDRGVPCGRNAGCENGGLLLYPSLLSHHDCPMEHAESTSFVLYNAQGLLSVALSPPSGDGARCDVRHVWAACQSGSSGSPTTCAREGLVGGVADLHMKSDGALHGVLLRGSAYAADKGPAKSDKDGTDAREESCDDFCASLARDLVVVGDLAMGPLCCAPLPDPLAAHMSDPTGEGSALALSAAEDVVRRVVREELTLAVAPLESRLSRLEAMLQKILDHASVQGSV